MSRAAVDVYVGPAPAGMLTSTLRRGRAAVTVHPGPAAAAGLAEVLLCEATDQHADADWDCLAARGSTR